MAVSCGYSAPGFYPAVVVFFFAAVFGFTKLHVSVSGQQISTACTTSLISTFTPCFDYLTGSSNGGSGPSGDCCTTFASLISSSTQCACLILTGNVPVSFRLFNKTLALSLSPLCGRTSVPLQCNYAVGAPLPGPGPVSYGPSLPPLPPQPPLPAGSVDSPPPSLSPPGIASPPSIADTPLKQRPLIFPNSDEKLSAVNFLSIVLISFILPLNYVL
ncbi:hypothetical protein KSP39_PZI002844 [Platanthera zijinensis]|uniref:Bifunctional inhibitor/plant lipid transfer protein/seed storage helical domain-containing protein n=1 Tax=Platanthera zijinensis TaxID=2320716 RepID=A0AAP0BXZ9_9ASPA